MPVKHPFETNLTTTTEVVKSRTNEMNQALTKAQTKARDEAQITYSGSYGATYRPSLHSQKNRRSK